MPRSCSLCLLEPETIFCESGLNRYSRNMIQGPLQKLYSLINPTVLNPNSTTTEIRPDDVFLVSYPKSGNTWMRFLVGNYLTNCKINFFNIDLVIPDIHFNPQQCEDVTLQPRFIKSHKSYTPAYPKVVYIFRDGRDVAVSYYYYMKKKRKITSDTSFSNFLETFAKNGAGGFGNWSNHVKSWVKKASTGSVVLIKYEDMLFDAARELKKVIQFANIKAEQDRIINAVRASLFEEMQQLEVKENDSYFFTRYKAGTEEVRFIRKGQAEGWRSHFSKDDENLFLKFNGKTLKKLGYAE